MGKTDLGIPRRSKSAKVVLGSETQLDPRTCGLAAWEFGTGSFFMQWTAFWFAQDNYQSERFYTELLASSVHIANVGRFLLPPKPRHRSDPIMYGIAWIMSSCLASGTFAILESYQRYYNEARTYLSLCEDAPVARAVQAVGGVVAKPLLGRLHHRYIFLRREQLRKRDTKTMSVTSSMHKRGHSDAIAERQRRPGGPLG
jgi:hypothetical protein